MSVRIVFSRRAEKEVLELPLADRDRIRERITAYAEEPDHPRHDVRPVVGAKDVFRLRSGDWRVLFVREGESLIWGQRVLHRREAYR